MTSTALERANKAALDRANKAEASIKDLVRHNWDAVKDSLPATMEPKRFARLVFNAVRKTPKLGDCTAVSMIGSLIAASSIGVEVNTPLQEAYLIPYGSEATFIMGYQGYVKLFRQHPDADDVSSGWIGAKDVLEYSYGRDKHLTHKPTLADRGACIGVWAMYTLKSGGWDFVVLTMDQVKALRLKDEGGDVRDPEHWMARKTALRQVLKLAPKSSAMAAAMAADEHTGRDAARAAGVAVHLPDAQNISTVAGSIEPSRDDEPERIDEQTGEVLDAEVVEEGAGEGAHQPVEGGPGVAPSSSSGMVKRATVIAIGRELARCGVGANEVDSYLGVLGVPRDRVTDLTQAEAEELLVAVRGLDRDKLAELVADMSGGVR